MKTRFRFNNSWLALGALVMVLTACTSQSTHVDIKSVTETQDVTPVNGIRVSGQPDAAALEVFSASGFETVIDLRGADEQRGIDEQAVVEGLGMTYVSFPVEGRGAVNFDNAAKLTELIESADGPVLVHCGSGNRVAALLTLQRSTEGADDEAALEFGRQAGLTRLEDLVKERLQESR
ncbi:MAG: hypothetical protein KJO82_05405 [Gammaproteobacteria bacterium]|nr:hypothetical protein [Gammaproteobacteria bacterium]